ncbi:MAG: DUF3086 domain-containing protein [Cyanobacteriota bacterium]|nr:DUF3086 domain-containing protein [Cyanobacteriota bacterium]
MNSDDAPQTPEQKLEQAFIDESEETNWSDSEGDLDPSVEALGETEPLAPLPELTLEHSKSSEPERAEPLQSSELEESPESEYSAASPAPSLEHSAPEPAQSSQSLEIAATEALATAPSEEPKIPESEAEPEPQQPIALDTDVPSSPPESEDIEARQGEIEELERRKAALTEEIRSLQAAKEELLSEQIAQVRATLDRLVQESLSELEGRKQTLQLSIEKLERRRDRVSEEMRASFAGVSQDMAIRVQGFKDYLVGSLQDLSAAAEQLELPSFEPPREKPRPEVPTRSRGGNRDEPPTPRFAKQSFQEQRQHIANLLEQYRIRPDYYGPAWQLRRTFEPIHAERVQKWFFSQGGRGSVRTMGSRLQNILVASAATSVLRNLYSDRLRTLVLANTPERLGEWRRGLQDCLGISRSDFGPTRGVVLFESPDALVQKADRLVEDKFLPFVIIDEAEGQIDLALLQFPLWLAFAPDPSSMSSYLY